MSNEIEKGKDTVQQTCADPNLGGPTSTHLDKREILNNLAWALSFEQLNGGRL